MNNVIKAKRKGLPNYFKKVGIVVFVLSFPLIFLLKELGVELEKELFMRTFFSITLIAGFLFIGSREKIEDEMIEKIRMTSLASSFMFTIGYSLFGVWLVEDFGVQQLTFAAIIVYITTFYIQKRKL